MNDNKKSISPSEDLAKHRRDEYERMKNHTFNNSFGLPAFPDDPDAHNGAGCYDNDTDFS